MASVAARDTPVHAAMSLIRPANAKAWDLRAAWATGLRVALTLDNDDPARIEGHVSCVAASGAFAQVAGRHVPLERVLAVHNPSRLGDSTIGPDERWQGRARRRQPQVEQLPLGL